MQTRTVERAFTEFLSFEDRIDVRFRRTRNRIVDFALNYRAFIGGRWREIIRYDTAHHQPVHRHRFWPPHEGAKELLENERQQDHSQAFTQCRRHLRDHWREYRCRFESGHRR